jgi:hypothetical protein
MLADSNEQARLTQEKADHLDLKDFRCSGSHENNSALSKFRNYQI